MTLIDEAKRVADEFEFTPDNARKAVKQFLKEMDEGLDADGTSLSQIPTFVTAVPNGNEKGLFLAVDLGGTNFRVCSINLLGDTTFTLQQSKVAIPRELMVAKTSEELFGFMAKQIETFLKTHHADHFEAYVRRRSTLSREEGYTDELIFQLGFTFSFPVHQISINKGNLIRWTKGFDIKDTIGKDVCGLLQHEINKRRLPVRVAALVNDTVGTLMARSYTSPGKTGTLLGAIFGTGTNGAYVEKLDRVKKMTGNPHVGDYDKTTGEMIINTEWGSFDPSLAVLPTTQYDLELDKESNNPGIQLFEKRISGMFLGEVLRRAILALVNTPHIQLFKDENSSSNELHSTTTISESSPIYKQWGIDTSFLSIVHADTGKGLHATRQVLERELGVDAASEEDARAVKIIVEAVGKRSARLSAIAIGAVIIASGRLGQPLKTDASGQVVKPASAILNHAKNLEVGAAAQAAAQKLQSAAGSLINDIPLETATSILEDNVDIGVDGSLVEFYPGFEDYMREVLREIPEIGSAGERRVTIGIAKDGSGVGAALIALVAATQAPPPAEEGYLPSGGNTPLTNLSRTHSPNRAAIAADRPI
ncbi:MAG: glucokinase [Vezdaea aestivalis]|nr:MAG: glucokinase [Vezdaea aestivalis]